MMVTLGWLGLLMRIHHEASVAGRLARAAAGACAMKRGTVLIMAGGTGGHVFPALAAARVLRERGFEPVWLGTQRGLEAKLVPPQHIEIEWISVSGLRGKGVRDLARSAVQAVAGDLAEPAGHAAPASGRRAGRGRIRVGPGRRRGLADAPAAGDPRAERGRRHDQSLAGAVSRGACSKHFPASFPPRCACRAVGNPVRREIAALRAARSNASRNAAGRCACSSSAAARALRV